MKIIIDAGSETAHDPNNANNNAVVRIMRIFFAKMEMQNAEKRSNIPFQSLKNHPKCEKILS